MAEGAPLLREYANKIRIEGSNPSFSANLLSFGYIGFPGGCCCTPKLLYDVGYCCLYILINS